MTIPAYSGGPRPAAPAIEPNRIIPAWAGGRRLPPPPEPPKKPPAPRPPLLPALWAGAHPSLADVTQS